ncbi:MAG: 30S ribosomal protein S6 [Candidatus Gribaldobacteria bacterium]|nr:30S ribosomal protein S6 [Candidatus Gribaldobacteria bacterium]
MPKIYDLTYLISPDLSENEAQQLAQQIEAGLIESKTIKTETPRMIGLSYAIKKQTTAFLANIIFETEPAKIEEIKNNLEKEEKILRFLLTSRKHLPETPVLIINEKISEPVVIATPEPVAEPEVKPEKVKKVTKSVKSKKVAADKDQEQETDLKQIGDDLDEILNTPLTEN